LVTLFGGWGALAGVILVGPRIGKLNVNGKTVDKPGGSVLWAVIGVFMLWLVGSDSTGARVLSAIRLCFPCFG